MSRALPKVPRQPTPRQSKPVHEPAASAAKEVNVIHGINLKVTGRELGVRLAERIRWHRERGDSLVAQLAKLAQIERSADADMAEALGRFYDSPRLLLERRLHEHHDRASFLAFVRDHLTPDAVYRLGATDLKMIDVVPDGIR